MLNTQRSEFCKANSDSLVLFVNKQLFLAEIDKQELLREEITLMVLTKKRMIEKSKEKIAAQILAKKKQGLQEKPDQQQETPSHTLPNSSKHFYHFLKGYNSYKEKVTKQSIRFVYPPESFKFPSQPKESTDMNHHERDMNQLNDEPSSSENSDNEIVADKEDQEQMTRMQANPVKLKIRSSLFSFAFRSNNRQSNSSKFNLKIASKNRIKRSLFTKNTTTETQLPTSARTKNSITDRQSIFNVQTVDDNDKNEKIPDASDLPPPPALLAHREITDQNTTIQQDNKSVKQKDNPETTITTEGSQSRSILQAKIAKITKNIDQIESLKREFAKLLKEVNMKKATLNELTVKESSQLSNVQRSRSRSRTGTLTSISIDQNHNHINN